MSGRNFKADELAFFPYDLVPSRMVVYDIQGAWLPWYCRCRHHSARSIRLRWDWCLAHPV